MAVSTATAGYGGHTDTAYSLVLPTAATGGTWTVTAANQTTVALPYNATAAEVKVAIAAISSVGQGNVNVSGVGSPAQPFVATFTEALAATAVSLSANYSGITTGSASQPGSSTQTSWGGPGTDEQEVVGYAATGSYGVTGGEFDLTYNGQTRAVAYNATPGDVKSALVGIGLTDIEVTGPSGSGIGSTGAAVYTITFVGSLGGKYLPQPVIAEDDPSSPPCSRSSSRKPAAASRSAMVATRRLPKAWANRRPTCKRPWRACPAWRRSRSRAAARWRAPIW